MKPTTGSRAHVMSAVWAAGYALSLHLVYLAVFPIMYLIQGGAWGATVIADLIMIVLFLVVFFVIRRFPAEHLTFYAVLLLCHIALSALFWALAEPVFGSMIHALQDKVGIQLTGQPEENFDGVYLLIKEVLMQVIFGLVFFMTMLASLVKSEVKRVVGATKSREKSEKEN